MTGLKSVILIIFYAFLSWILIHLLAVSGVFIALAYPMWWAVLPQKTICFSCRSLKEGKKCKFCNKVVDKKDPSYLRVSSLRSAIYNAFLILAFTIISIALVCAEARVLNKLGIPPTPKTVSFIIPSKGQYRLGEVFPMKIEIIGIETPINAIQADISFDPAIAEVLDINTDESFADVFIQKEINNEDGYARLTGGLPNPGFFAEKGVFGTVLFRSKSPGIVKVDFLPTSLVLANDGRGTNVLKDLASVSFLILPEPITGEEQELQKKLITMGGNVMGAKSNRTQIKFYNEGSILGAETQTQSSESTHVEDSVTRMGPFTWFLHMVEKFDSFVLDVLSRIFGSSQE